MPYVELELPNGTKVNAHVRMPQARTKRCAYPGCPEDGAYLCDHPAGKRRDGSERTCDRPCCAAHRQHVEAGRDLCLEHAPQSGTTFGEIDERVAELKRELVLANDARDWPRFCAADRELDQLFVRRRHLGAAADAAVPLERAASRNPFNAIAAQAIAAMPQEDTQCRLF